MYALSLIAALLIASPDDDAAAALAIAKAKKSVQSKSLLKVEKSDDDAAAAIAIAKTKVVQPKPPVVMQKKITDTTKAKQRAIEKNCALVLFVNTPVNVADLTGTFVAAYLDEYQGDDTPRIVVAVPDGEGGLIYNQVGGIWHLPPNADAKAIEAMAAAQAAAVRRTVSQPATPFDKSNSNRNGQRQQIADGSPWLPVREQSKIKDMWPEGVPFPETLQFYALPKASQRIATTNDRPSRGFHSVRTDEKNINAEYPYIGSGGMDFAKKGTWHNVTGLAIPEGDKIKVWAQRTPVLNSFGSYQQEEAMFWTFPKGTQAFDVLLRKNDYGSEHIFTIRKREKVGDKWDDGVQYFVKTATVEEPPLKAEPTLRLRNVLGVTKLVFPVARAQAKLERNKRQQFAESRIAVADDGHFTPPGFIGTGISCNKCHVVGMNSEDAPYAGPALRGRDGVFSFYPVLPESVDRDYYIPRLDRRWPLEVIGRVE